MSKDREIVSTRTVPYSPTSVYEAWTTAELLARWWGPKGFTNTFHEFDPRPGGRWKFTMHAPGGGSFDNECVFVEVVPEKRIVFDHVEPVHAFRVTATFEEGGKNGTLVTFRMLFESAEECQRSRPVIEPANEENFDRLEAVLADHVKSIK